MKKIVLMFMVVLMVLTSCIVNKSAPTYLPSETATSPSETATVKRVTKVGTGEEYHHFRQINVLILLENGIMLYTEWRIDEIPFLLDKAVDKINYKDWYIKRMPLFVEPGDTIVYKGNEVVEVKFKN